LYPRHRYGKDNDDTFAKLKKMYVDEFMTHLNAQHPRIKFTTDVLEDNKIAFLDTHVTLEVDGTVSFNVYRKKTHTDQYLDFSSHHYANQKIGLYKNFKNRINTIVTKDEDKAAEDNHVKDALRRCGHPEWALSDKKKLRKESAEPSLGRVSVPYVAKTSEKVAKTFRRYGIQTSHRPVQTIRSIMYAKRKDKVEDLDKSGVIYHCECKRCSQSYVGETGRCMRVRMYDHKVVSHKQSKISHSVDSSQLQQLQASSQAEPIEQRRSIRLRDMPEVNYSERNGTGQLMSDSSSALYRHMASAYHQEGDVTVRVVASEQTRWRRKLKEALAIHNLNPTLNEDDGGYRISQIYTLLPKFAARKKEETTGMGPLVND